MAALGLWIGKVSTFDMEKYIQQTKDGKVSTFDMEKYIQQIKDVGDRIVCLLFLL